MYIEFASRMIGMVIFALVGARLGVTAAATLALPELGVSFIFSLVGILFGLIMTPWITVRPVRALSRFINEMPIDALVHHAFRDGAWADYRAAGGVSAFAARSPRSDRCCLCSCWCSAFTC